MISLDLSVAEIMEIPEAMAVLHEELPMMRRFGGRRGGGDAPLRAMLTRSNPMFSFPADVVERIEKRLLALN